MRQVVFLLMSVAPSDVQMPVCASAPIHLPAVRELITQIRATPLFLAASATAAATAGPTLGSNAFGMI